METHFSDLRESNEFLNLLLDNMNSAVLIADENLQINHFNDTFLQLFSKSEENVLVSKFGKATSCAFSVEEEKPCGETTHCESCVLRRAALRTMVEKIPVDNMRMERAFYIDGKPVVKYLDISTRHITFQGRKMILLILYDVTELETQKLELQKRQDQIERDLKAAAGIQRSLLPQFPPANGAVKMAWHFEPSRQIGGDIFNIHYPSDDRVDIYILDVCGHGVSAALVAVSVSQFLHSKKNLSKHHLKRRSPKKILDSLEQAFPFEHFDTYFTLLYMTINLSQGTLTYGSAGHPPPVLLRRNGEIEVLDLHGPAIGFGNGSIFKHEEKSLQPGDKVVLYTDGILEAQNPGGELFGKHRFYEALAGCAKSSAKQTTKKIYSEVKTFTEETEFDDDVSILVLKFMGN
ncbi:MAG: PP2C family protein-serine/threonine phosphatase [Desulforhabdus sp.]|jgi:sigma-B regulation protein RsbU (phosphoserine phosphatase)|nr:PP2C family protein-serine/threonine phosphatase [Desulforhabdus sp.]